MATLADNYVITGAWALAFAVMVLAELALLYVPDLPRRDRIDAPVLHHPIGESCVAAALRVTRMRRSTQCE